MHKILLFSITKKDLIVEYFSGTGSGGQHRNKHQNCVRLHHPASGTLVTGQSYRERRYNIKEALGNLVKHPKFKIWHSRKVMEIQEGKSIEEKVDMLMAASNLAIEIKDGEGKWTKWNS